MAIFMYCAAFAAGHATAESVVIPAEFADVEGSLVLGFAPNPGLFRFHLLYHAWEFPQQPVDIIGMRVRPKSDVAEKSPIYPDLQISLTTTKEETLDLDFDVNYERTPNAPILVLDRTVETSTVSELPGPSPRPFDYEFSWEDTPFRYDPANGTNLLVDFLARGGFSESPRWDAFLTQSRVPGMRRRVVLEVYGSPRYETRFPVTEFLYRPAEPRPTELQAGDADMDLDFDQLDLVQVQISGKYLTGQPATWGDGDWNGAPGGSQGSAPSGDGLFDQLDVVSALVGGKYLTGSYRAINEAAMQRADRTPINMSPALPTGDVARAIGGNFSIDADDTIFQTIVGGSYGVTVGNVAAAGHLEASPDDSTIAGSLAGISGLADVGLTFVAVPEPPTALLLIACMCAAFLHAWRYQRHTLVNTDR